MTHTKKHTAKDKQPAFDPVKPATLTNEQPLAEPDLDGEPVEEKAIQPPPGNNDKQRNKQKKQ
jgi:hypothetical protein